MNVKSQANHYFKVSKIAACAMVMTSASVFAETNIENDSCNVELNYGLQIKGEHITFYDGKKEIYRIEQDQYLIVNQEPVALNGSSQALVEDYSQGIRGMVPKVRDIAVEGIELAAEGVNMAFGELLGHDDSFVVELDEEFGLLRDEISERFNEENFSMNYDSDDASNWEDEFENRIEELVEDAVEKSIGSLMIAIGTQMLTSGGDMDEFEKNMEDFGERIEYQMETKAEAIEKRADQLCVSIEELAIIERQLIDQVPELEEYQVIDYQSGESKKKHYRM